MLDLLIKATNSEAEFTWNTVAKNGSKLDLAKWMAWTSFMKGRNKMNLITYSIYLNTVNMTMNSRQEQMQKQAEMIRLATMFQIPSNLVP